MKLLAESICCFTVAACLALPVAAQTYPVKPVRLVTEFIPGSGGDAFLRLVMGPMGASLGQPIVIDNRPGAGGLVAAETVVQAAPDGYTLLGSSPNVHTIRPFLSRVNPIDTLKDLTPITDLAEPVLAIVAHPSLPANNLRELIDYARKNPGKVSYGTSGIGSSLHLDGEQIQMLTGIKLVHVPYKALQQALGDVVTGQLPITFTLAGQAAGHVKAGKLKALAVVGSRRFHAWPDVAPVAEAVPSFEPPAAWTALFGPAGLPGPITQRIYADAMKALGDPKVKAKLTALGFDIHGQKPEQFTAHIRRQRELIGNIVKTAGIQPTE